MLTTFGNELNVAVFGATGGIGAALAATLAEDDSVRRVFACARNPQQSTGKTIGISVDVTDEATIESASQLMAEAGEIHLVVVATGILHGDGFGPEKRWADLDAQALALMFQVNTIGPALVAKHTLSQLARCRKTVFAALSARVGSIEDNQLGGWHGYRASKAALNMTIRSCAIELGHKNPDAACVALHPGTVATNLSEPFRRSVPAGSLFSPKTSARHLLNVIDRLTVADTGGLFAWDGKRIPY